MVRQRRTAASPQGPLTPPMQLLVSMLNTSTDEGERALLLAKLRAVVESTMVRGVFVVSR